jgi:hypothetical protein
MHTLRQTGLLRIECLGSPDVLTAYPTWLPCRCSALATEFKLKLCQAGGGDVSRGPE